MFKLRVAITYMTTPNKNSSSLYIFFSVFNYNKIMEINFVDNINSYRNFFQYFIIKIIFLIHITSKKLLMNFKNENHIFRVKIKFVCIRNVKII